MQCTELLYLWYLHYFSKFTNWFAGVVRTVIAVVKLIYLEDIDLYFCKPGFLFYAAPDISSDFKEGESISGTAGSSATDVAGG